MSTAIGHVNGAESAGCDQTAQRPLVDLELLGGL
jgi:hypothetical protein